MPRRRKLLAKLSKEEINKDGVKKCCIRKEGNGNWMLTECIHSNFEEILISSKLTCVPCEWEGLDTDPEYPESD